ncbi:MAG: ribosomal protein [Caulobacter sp.]|nr:ribosomal protein [Caulobacter sp.]
MYAVIKTGGKQYRVQAGDLLVVEKLAGEPGDAVNFGEVLMLGDGEAVTVGAPMVDGAVVAATLIETRKGEKVKIFKKIRRQGYRRTRGHRQTETVLRVTSVAGGGKTVKWDGVVDMTTKAVLDARARNLKNVVEALTTGAPVAKANKRDVAPAKSSTETVVKAKKSSPIVEAQVVEHADAVATEAPKKTEAPKTEAKAAAAPKKAAAPKAEAATEKTAAPKKAAAPKAAAVKKPAAKKDDGKA